MSFIGDIFSGIGDIQEGSSFSQAAKIEQQNTKLQKEITAVNVAQSRRQVFQALGSEEASTGAAGVRMMGSSAALMNASAYQGALRTQAVKTQGIIQENAYAAQAGAYAGEASAMKSSGAGGILGGIVGGIASIFSDERLKENIIKVGEFEPGIGLYEFSYKKQVGRYVGVLAQEVEKVRPDCVDIDPDGYRFVNYDKLGLEVRCA